MTLPRIAVQPARGWAQLDGASHGLSVLAAGDDLPADLRISRQERLTLPVRRLEQK
jgi:hypothetical protein